MDTYIVTDNNVKIKDGWIYGKESFDGILNWLRSLYPGNNVFKNRTNKSLKREWACHNFLYICASRAHARKTWTWTGRSPGT